MKLSFNENWICYKTGEKEDAFAVTLPHDAMQLDERSETSAGEVNTGWYEAQDYTYEKTFILPEEAKEEKVICWNLKAFTVKQAYILMMKKWHIIPMVTLVFM